MSKPAVLVIGGGPSLEREIALLSSKAVYNSLTAQNYTAEFYDWDGSTDWLDANLGRFDVVLPILHGIGGEDGKIQTILERSNCKYLGSTPEVSALCFDKDTTLKKLIVDSIRTPKGSTVTLEQYLQHPLFKTAHVLKPFNGGSSIDTYIFDEPGERPVSQIEKSFTKYDRMLLEEYLDGVEITVPILGETVMPVIEIRPPKNGVFDYANKYNGATVELCPPQNISTELQQAAQQLALRVHTLLGCRHLSRVDMIVVGDLLYVLEINTLPGMTSQSLYPKSLAVAGYDFDTLIADLVDMVQNGENI